MPSKAITYQDMTVTVSSNLLGGNVQVRVQCPGYDQTMTMQEFAALIYPAIKQTVIITSSKES